MINSKFKQLGRMGSIAALSLLLVLPSFMVVPAPIQASAGEMDMIADRQNDQAGSSQLGTSEEPIGGVDSMTDGNAGDDVEAPTGESEGVEPEENVDEQDDTQAAEDGEVDLLAESVTQTVYTVEPLFNNGFELPVNANGTIPGWSMFFAPNDGTSYEITQDVRYYGNSSLKLVDKSNSLPIYLQSNERSVTPGYTYNGSAMMYIAPNAGNAAGASLVLRFYDATGKQVNTDKDGENIVHLRQVGVWTRVTVTGVAPATAAYARVAASISNYFTAESGAFYDDFTLTSPQEEKAPGTLHLQMPTGILANQLIEAKILLTRGIDVETAFGSLAYDPTTLEVVDASVASDFNAGGLATLELSDDEPGVLKFKVLRPEGSSVSEDKQVLNVKFKVIGNAEKVDVTLQEDSGVQDIDGVQNNKIYISLEAESASTYIRRASLDVNGDGKLDLYDVMAVAKLVGQMATNDNWKYDVNNDGRIDQADVEMLTDAILTKLLDENEGGRSL
ncbi:dockerin type I domain-containing protein [Paenibacillus sp. D2_2]|uniref:dockerin type I domain-containing protein n=1 Tax=Paenibacillus sp. D2_2 TaxID=3073092 RepID=UPI002816379F|nr:dockerin type I domain-containing protein [Paenibacillus sp. D2_2]WMT39889.1 dockerin type I domain-containing protein [Paenibacillus sp. D2_2]